MILRINIQNLFSFKDETSISFVAGKSGVHRNQVCRAEKRDDISVLKAGIIYGANASGKSNIIKAVDVLRRIAISGIPKKMIEPFKLAQVSNTNSNVELEFKVADRYFAYGVVFSIKGIAEEWLYEINSRSDKEIFSRKVSSEGNDFSFGQIAGDNETVQLIKFISQSTPTTDSFLAEYVKRNGKGMPCVYDVHKWFRDNLKIIFPTSRYEGLSVTVEQDDDYRVATKALLDYFNTGIIDIRRTKVLKEDVELPKEIIDNILAESTPNNNVIVASKSDSRIYFFETNGDGIVSIFKQTLIHRNENDDEVPFEMSEESDGSLRLLDFIPMLIDLSINNSVYLIDEIDRSMHPMMSQRLLEYYFDNLSEDKQTQLIFTTHESNLLDLNFIRADEVWFVEKDRYGASHLTSLAEYKPREDVKKGYLQGRYGAIPFFATTKRLKW